MKMLLGPIYVWSKVSGLIVWFAQGYMFKIYSYQSKREMSAQKLSPN